MRTKILMRRVVVSVLGNGGLNYLQSIPDRHFDDDDRSYGRGVHCPLLTALSIKSMRSAEFSSNITQNLLDLCYRTTLIGVYINLTALTIGNLIDFDLRV